MKTIRPSVFETNSSSTHSLIIMEESDYNKLQQGKLALDLYGNKIISDNLIEIIKNNDGSYKFDDCVYNSISDLVRKGVIGKHYATKEYIDGFADVEEKKIENKIIISIYVDD